MLLQFTISYSGTRDYARNYGLIFTAHGIYAVTENLMVGAAKDALGEYINVFPMQLLFGQV